VYSQALTGIVARLQTAQRDGLLGRYGLIGGLAVSAWGVPRATKDIDFAVAVEPGTPAALAQALDGIYRAGTEEDPLRGVISIEMAVEGETVPIQLVFFPRTWSNVVFGCLQEFTLLGCSVPVVDWPILVLLKLYAGGPQDLLDAQELLAVRQPDPRTLDDLRKQAEAVGVSTELADLLTRLNAEEP
jgi:hypothetical protein